MKQNRIWQSLLRGHWQITFWKLVTACPEYLDIRVDSLVTWRSFQYRSVQQASHITWHWSRGITYWQLHQPPHLSVQVLASHLRSNYHHLPQAHCHTAKGKSSLNKWETVTSNENIFANQHFCVIVDNSLHSPALHCSLCNTLPLRFLLLSCIEGLRQGCLLSAEWIWAHIDNCFTHSAIVDMGYPFWFIYKITVTNCWRLKDCFKIMLILH